MFGFEKMFDFNHDGKLGSFERATEFMVFHEIMNSNDDSEESDDEDPDDFHEDENGDLYDDDREINNED